MSDKIKFDLKDQSKRMNYKHNLTEEQNIAIDKIFPYWTMERDENGFIVIYPNIQDEEEG